MALKEISDHRNIDIQKLRNELNHNVEVNSRLKSDLNSAESEISCLKEDVQKLNNDIDIE